MYNPEPEAISSSTRGAASGKKRAGEKREAAHGLQEGHRRRFTGAGIGMPASAYLGKASRQPDASLLQLADAAPGPDQLGKITLPFRLAATKRAEQWRCSAQWPGLAVISLEKRGCQGVTVMEQKEQWSRKNARPVFGNSLER